MQRYHKVWLRAHPHRTREWLSERLKDGFEIHHWDGDSNNDAPENLILIEVFDHRKLHGQRLKVFFPYKTDMYLGEIAYHARVRTQLA